MNRRFFLFVFSSRRRVDPSVTHTILFLEALRHHTPQPLHFVLYTTSDCAPDLAVTLATRAGLGPTFTFFTLILAYFTLLLLLLHGFTHWPLVSTGWLLLVYTLFLGSYLFSTSSYLYSSLFPASHCGLPRCSTFLFLLARSVLYVCL